MEFRTPCDLCNADAASDKAGWLECDGLRAALIEAEGSGESAPFDFDALVAEKRGSRVAGGTTWFALSPAAKADQEFPRGAGMD